jgi:hypothetical protein
MWGYHFINGVITWVYNQLITGKGPLWAITLVTLSDDFLYLSAETLIYCSNSVYQVG